MVSKGHDAVDGNSVVSRLPVRRDLVQPLQQGRLPGTRNGRSGAAEPRGRRELPLEVLRAHGREGARVFVVRVIDCLPAPSLFVLCVVMCVCVCCGSV